METALTARQEAFCRAFVGGAGSAAEAARQAGYSTHTARAQASRLLHSPAVTARIDALRADTETAKAALCARLWARVERLAGRAEAEGKIGLAMRGLAMQMRLVRDFGLPALPADCFELSVEALGADPAEVCGDVAVDEDTLTDVDADRLTEAAATTTACRDTPVPARVAAELRHFVFTHVDNDAGTACPEPDRETNRESATARARSPQSFPPLAGRDLHGRGSAPTGRDPAEGVARGQHDDRYPTRERRGPKRNGMPSCAAVNASRDDSDHAAITTGRAPDIAPVVPLKTWAWACVP